MLGPVDERKHLGGGGLSRDPNDIRAEGRIIYYDPLDQLPTEHKTERQEQWVKTKESKTSRFTRQEPETIKGKFLKGLEYVGRKVRGGRSEGFVPNFINNFEIEEMSAQSLGASSSVQAHTSRGTIDGRRFTMNNQETEITGSEISQLTGLKTKAGDSFVGPKYGPDLKGELNTRINKKGGRMIVAEGYVPNFVPGGGREARIDPAKPDSWFDKTPIGKFFKDRKIKKAVEESKNYAADNLIREFSPELKMKVDESREGEAEHQKQLEIMKSQPADGFINEYLKTPGTPEILLAGLGGTTQAGTGILTKMLSKKALTAYAASEAMSIPLGATLDPAMGKGIYLETMESHFLTDTILKNLETRFANLQKMDQGKLEELAGGAEGAKQLKERYAREILETVQTIQGASRSKRAAGQESWFKEGMDPHTQATNQKTDWSKEQLTGLSDEKMEQALKDARALVPKFDLETHKQQGQQFVDQQILEGAVLGAAAGPGAAALQEGTSKIKKSVDAKVFPKTRKNLSGKIPSPIKTPLKLGGGVLKFGGRLSAGVVSYMATDTSAVGQKIRESMNFPYSPHEHLLGASQKLLEQKQERTMRSFGIAKSETHEKQGQFYSKQDYDELDEIQGKFTQEASNSQIPRSKETQKIWQQIKEDYALGGEREDLIAAVKDPEGAKERIFQNKNNTQTWEERRELSAFNKKIYRPQGFELKTPISKGREFLSSLPLPTEKFSRGFIPSFAEPPQDLNWEGIRFQLGEKGLELRSSRPDEELQEFWGDLGARIRKDHRDTGGKSGLTDYKFPQTSNPTTLFRVSPEKYAKPLLPEFFDNEEIPLRKYSLEPNLSWANLTTRAAAREGVGLTTAQQKEIWYERMKGQLKDAGAPDEILEEVEVQTSLANSRALHREKTSAAKASKPHTNIDWSSLSEDEAREKSLHMLRGDAPLDERNRDAGRPVIEGLKEKGLPLEDANPRQYQYVKRQIAKLSPEGQKLVKDDALRGSMTAEQRKEVEWPKFQADVGLEMTTTRRGHQGDMAADTLAEFSEKMDLGETSRFTRATPPSMLDKIKSTLGKIARKFRGGKAEGHVPNFVLPRTFALMKEDYQRFQEKERGSREKSPWPTVGGIDMGEEIKRLEQEGDETRLVHSPSTSGGFSRREPYSAEGLINTKFNQVEWARGVIAGHEERKGAFPAPQGQKRRVGKTGLKPYDIPFHKFTQDQSDEFATMVDTDRINKLFEAQDIMERWHLATGLEFEVANTSAARLGKQINLQDDVYDEEIAKGTPKEKAEKLAFAARKELREQQAKQLVDLVQRLTKDGSITKEGLQRRTELTDPNTYLSKREKIPGYYKDVYGGAAEKMGTLEAWMKGSELGPRHWDKHTGEELGWSATDEGLIPGSPMINFAKNQRGVGHKLLGFDDARGIPRGDKQRIMQRPLSLQLTDEGDMRFSDTTTQSSFFDDTPRELQYKLFEALGKDLDVKSKYPDHPPFLTWQAETRAYPEFANHTLDEDAIKEYARGNHRAYFEQADKEEHVRALKKKQSELRDKVLRLGRFSEVDKERLRAEWSRRDQGISKAPVGEPIQMDISDFPAPQIFSGPGIFSAEMGPLERVPPKSDPAKAKTGAGISLDYDLDTEGFPKSQGHIPNFRGEENNKIANKLAFNRLTREGRFLHDEKVKKSLIDSFKSDNTDSRPLGESNPFAPIGHPEGEPLPMLRSERSKEERVMGEDTLLALPPRHDITGGIGQTLNLGMRTLGTSLHQAHFDNNTAGQVLRAAYPDIMKEVGGVDELVGGLGEETVIKMLKRAAKERMTGGDLENMVSFLASVGTTKMGPFMGPLAGALATSAQVDDFQSETFYGTAAGEGRELANMTPLLPVKNILKTLRSFNLRGPRVAQLGQGLDKANAANVIGQGADAVSDLAGITDLDTFIDSQVRPDKSGLKELKGLSEEEIKDLIAKPTDKRFQMNLLNNKGYVPNFADPLTDAIQREQLHVPNYAVRVGQDQALSSTQNPLGLGVYNTFDEPMGLNQGVTRAKSEGQNPKTYGLSSTLAAKGNVPNFQRATAEERRDAINKVLEDQKKEEERQREITEQLKENQNVLDGVGAVLGMGTVSSTDLEGFGPDTLIDDTSKWPTDTARPDAKTPPIPHGGPATPVVEKTKNPQATRWAQDKVIGDFDLLESLDPVKTRKSLAPAPQSDAQKQKLEEAKQDLAGYERSLLPSPKLGDKEEKDFDYKKAGGSPVVNIIHKAIMDGKPLNEVLDILHKFQGSPERSTKEKEQGYPDNIVTDQMVKSYFRDETGFTQLQAQSAKLAKEVEEGRNERDFKQASTKGILPESMVAPMAARKQAEALIKEYKENPSSHNLQEAQQSFEKLSPSQQKDLVTWNQQAGQIPRNEAQRQTHAKLFGYGAKIEGGKPGGILGNRFKIQADIKRPGLVADGATLGAATASVNKQLDYAQALHARGQMSDEEYERFEDIGDLAPSKIQQEQLNAALQFQGMTMIKKREFLKNIIAQKKAAASKKGHTLTDQQALAQYLIEAERKFGDEFEGKEVLNFMEGNAAFENIKLHEETIETEEVKKGNDLYVVKGGKDGEDFYIGAKNIEEAQALAKKGQEREIEIYKELKRKGNNDAANKALKNSKKFDTVNFVAGPIPPQAANWTDDDGNKIIDGELDAGKATRTETKRTITKGDIDPLLTFASQDVDELALKLHPIPEYGRTDKEGNTAIGLATHSQKEISQELEQARISARRVLDAVAGGPQAFEEKFNKATPDQRKKILDEMQAADALKFVPEKFRNNTDERAALINRSKSALSNKEYAALQVARAKEDPRAYQLRFMGASAEQRRAMINRLEESGAVPAALKSYTTEAAINTGVAGNFPIPQEGEGREAFFNKVRELKSQGLISNQQMIDLAMSDDLFDAINKRNSRFKFDGYIPNFGDSFSLNNAQKGYPMHTLGNAQKGYPMHTLGNAQKGYPMHTLGNAQKGYPMHTLGNAQKGYPMHTLGNAQKGYISNFVSNPIEGIERAGAYAAGYIPGVVREKEGMVYNTAEEFIPSFTLEKMTGMKVDGPAIIPPRGEARAKTLTTLTERLGTGARQFAAEGAVPVFQPIETIQPVVGGPGQGADPITHPGVDPSAPSDPGYTIDPPIDSKAPSDPGYTIDPPVGSDPSAPSDPGYTIDPPIDRKGPIDSADPGYTIDPPVGTDPSAPSDPGYTIDPPIDRKGPIDSADPGYTIDPPVGTDPSAPSDPGYTIDPPVGTDPSAPSDPGYTIDPPVGTDPSAPSDPGYTIDPPVGTDPSAPSDPGYTIDPPIDSKAPSDPVHSILKSDNNISLTSPGLRGLKGGGPSTPWTYGEFGWTQGPIGGAVTSSVPATPTLDSLMDKYYNDYDYDSIFGSDDMATPTMTDPSMETPSMTDPMYEEYDPMEETPANVAPDYEIDYDKYATPSPDPLKNPDSKAGMGYAGPDPTANIGGIASKINEGFSPPSMYDEDGELNLIPIGFEPSPEDDGAEARTPKDDIISLFDDVPSYTSDEINSAMMHVNPNTGKLRITINGETFNYDEMERGPQSQVEEKFDGVKWDGPGGYKEKYGAKPDESLTFGAMESEFDKPTVYDPMLTEADSYDPMIYTPANVPTTDLPVQGPLNQAGPGWWEAYDRGTEVRIDPASPPKPQSVLSKIADWFSGGSMEEQAMERATQSANENLADQIHELVDPEGFSLWKSDQEWAQDLIEQNELEAALHGGMGADSFTGGLLKDPMLELVTPGIPKATLAAMIPFMRVARRAVNPKVMDWTKPIKKDGKTVGYEEVVDLKQFTKKPKVKGETPIQQHHRLRQEAEAKSLGDKLSGYNERGDPLNEFGETANEYRARMLQDLGSQGPTGRAGTAGMAGAATTIASTADAMTASANMSESAPDITNPIYNQAGEFLGYGAPGAEGAQGTVGSQGKAQTFREMLNDQRIKATTPETKPKQRPLTEEFLLVEAYDHSQKLWNNGLGVDVSPVDKDGNPRKISEMDQEWMNKTSAKHKKLQQEQDDKDFEMLAKADTSGSMDSIMNPTPVSDPPQKKIIDPSKTTSPRRSRKSRGFTRRELLQISLLADKRKRHTNRKPVNYHKEDVKEGIYGDFGHIWKNTEIPGLRQPFDKGTIHKIGTPSSEWIKTPTVGKGSKGPTGEKGQLGPAGIIKDTSSKMDIRNPIYEGGQFMGYEGNMAHAINEIGAKGETGAKGKQGSSLSKHHSEGVNDYERDYLARSRESGFYWEWAGPPGAEHGNGPENRRLVPATGGFSPLGGMRQPIHDSDVSLEAMRKHGAVHRDQYGRFNPYYREKQVDPHPSIMEGLVKLGLNEEELYDVMDDVGARGGFQDEPLAPKSVRRPEPQPLPQRTPPPQAPVTQPSTVPPAMRNSGVAVRRPVPQPLPQHTPHWTPEGSPVLNEKGEIDDSWKHKNLESIFDRQTVDQGKVRALTPQEMLARPQYDTHGKDLKFRLNPIYTDIGTVTPKQVLKKVYDPDKMEQYGGMDKFLGDAERNREIGQKQREGTPRDVFPSNPSQWDRPFTVKRVTSPTLDDMNNKKYAAFKASQGLKWGGFQGGSSVFLPSGRLDKDGLDIPDDPKEFPWSDMGSTMVHEAGHGQTAAYGQWRDAKIKEHKRYINEDGRASSATKPQRDLILDQLEAHDKWNAGNKYKRDQPQSEGYYGQPQELDQKLKELKMQHFNSEDYIPKEGGWTEEDSKKALEKEWDIGGKKFYNTPQEWRDQMETDKTFKPFLIQRMGEVAQSTSPASGNTAGLAAGAATAAKGYIPNFATTLDSHDIEKLGAESLGYKAGNIKSIPNFAYNDAEKLIDPDYLNVQSAQIRGLGKPMSNPEGRAVVSPAIVPPKPSAAFDEYLPALARQLNVSKQEAQEVVLKAPRNKSFAFGGALPSVQKVPNFAPLDEKPEGLGAGPNAQFELLGAGVVAKAMDTFAATVPQLGGMIDKLGSIFSEGFQTNFDGNLTIQGLSQEFESLKADILAQVQKYVDGKEKQPSGANTYGNPGGLAQTAPRGIFNNGSETA